MKETNRGEAQFAVPIWLRASLPKPLNGFQWHLAPGDRGNLILAWQHKTFCFTGNSNRNLLGYSEMAQR
jgi:hypothetical protein